MNNPVETTLPARPPLFKRLGEALINPHASVTDFGDRRHARLLSILSLCLMLALVGGFVAAVLLRRVTNLVSFSLAPLFLAALGVFILSHTRIFRAGAWLLSLTISAAAYCEILIGANLISALFVNIGLALVVGSFFLATGAVVILLAVNVFAAAAMLFLLTPNLGPAVSVQGIGGVLILGFFIVLLSAMRDSLEHYRVSTLKAENESLANLRDELEKRVAEQSSYLISASENAQRRATQLKAISEISTSIAQIQEFNDLLPAITRQISDDLGFYHVGIFLLDERKEYAVLMATNSLGGQRMLQRGHRLRVGQVGIVGDVAERAAARISLDVGSDAVFFDNPDLPDTHSEMALPLIIGKELIGVIDVQSNLVSAFAQQDIEVMTTLANQVAVAIENARRFSATKQALSEAQAVYSQYLRQAWQQVPSELNLLGYQYTNATVKPLAQTVDRPENQAAVKSGELVVKSGENPALVVPIKVRDETIGLLNITSKSAGRQWDENEMALIRAITERVALALENARLFEETIRRADRERTVSDITTHIRSANDPDQMLQTALEDLKRALGVSDIQIRPYTPPYSGPAVSKTPPA